MVAFKFKARHCLISLVLFMSPCLLIGHDNEPINTEFASPLARRTANLNLDFQHFRSIMGEDTAGLDFEYGLAQRMQFSFRVPLTRGVFAPGQSAMGGGNLSLAYRYLLAGGNEKPFAVSINREAEFPTGNPGVADRAYVLGTAIHVDAHRGDKLWLHSNWGYETSVADFDEKEKNFRFAVAGMYEVTERLHSVIEVFGRRDFNGSVTEMSIAPGLIYSIGEHWELKAAVALGTNSSTPSCGIQFRLTWKIGPSGRQ